MDEVRIRAEKHIEAEESSTGKKQKEVGRLASIVERPEPQHARQQGRDRRDRGNKNKNRLGRPISDEGFTPLNAQPSDILNKSLRNGTIRRPAPFVGNIGRNTDSYCRYHRTDSHTTDDCWTLKQQIEQLIQKGALKKYTKEAETSEGKRRKGDPAGGTIQHETKKDLWRTTTTKPLTRGDQLYCRRIIRRRRNSISPKKVRQVGHDGGGQRGKYFAGISQDNLRGQRLQRRSPACRRPHRDLGDYEQFQGGQSSGRWRKLSKRHLW